MPLLADRRKAITVCSGCGNLVGEDHLPLGGTEEGILTHFTMSGTIEVMTVDEDYCMECMAKKKEFITGGVEAARRRLHDRHDTSQQD